jgi:hypothetical protein
MEILMKKAVLFLPFFAILSACQPPLTRDQELAFYRSRCFDYGYQLGTVEFANCMKEQEAREEELAVQARKAKALEDKNWIEQQKVRVKEREIAVKLQSKQ